MEQQNRSLFHRLIAAAVGAGMLATLAACAKPPAETAAPKEPVTAEKAITELQEQSEALGFDNALEELEEKNTATIGGDTYIRLQQHYEGIPVYGRTIVYAANEDGQMTSVTGNVQDIQEDIDLKPTVTKEEVQSSLSAYAKEKLGYASVDSVSLSFFDENLCIFVNDHEDGAALAYSVIASVTESGMSYPYEIVFDAHTGQILSCYSSVYTDWVPMTLEGPGGIDMLVDITEEQDEDGKTYYTMHDDRRNIHIISANNATLQFELYNYDDELVRDRDGNILKNEDTLDVYPIWISAKGVTEPISYSDPPRFEPEAVKLLSNLQTAYDYYEDVFGVSGFTVSSGRAQIYACYNDHLSGDTTNAYCWGYAGVPMYSMLFSFGSDNSLSLDTVAHEYTHAIERKRSCMKYEGESGAIMEALSDLYGELVESWATKTDPDWNHAGHRNIKDPSKSQLPESYGGVHWVNPDNTENDHGGVHYNNTVISHAAYLMWRGTDGNGSARLTTAELATLWYRAMLMMPSDCDFILCRQLVEVAAQSMDNLTDEQRACVREAFDRVGIPTVSEDTEADYHLDVNGTLSVYDENCEYYSGYTLSINGNPMRLPVGDRKPEIGFYYNKTVKVDSAGPYQVDLPAGLYLFKISDAYSPVTYSFTVQVGAGCASNIDLITAYEEPLVVVVPEPVQVADAYYDSVTFEGESGYFHIPEIICSDNRLVNANAQIYRELYDILDEYVYGEYMDLAGMSYSWTQYSNLVSILVEIEPWFWGPEYLTFNVDTESGKLLTNQEVAGYFDYTPEAFDRMVSEQMQQKYDDVLLLYLDQIAADTYGAFDVEGNRERTLSAENMETIHVFINSSGDLCMSAHLYRPGIEHPDYWHLFNLSGSAEPQPPVNVHKKIESAESGADQPDSDTGSALSELTYPISEEACYIIYENWIEGELDESEYAAVEKTYSPDSPHAFFSLEFYDLDDDGYSAGGMPDYYFEINLLTGECRTGATGSRPYTFQAEDYYY